jgi:hypothetical protein
MTNHADFEMRVWVPLIVDGVQISEDVECDVGIAFDADSDFFWPHYVTVIGLFPGEELELSADHWLRKALEPAIMADSDIQEECRNYRIENGG